ncbi:MAG: oligoribonuclease [Candidatus Dojkabacteria bacterium]|jgi:oligoribonuclease|nr:oligoribonuclease [Candidatus Dojkabacteria bacterium]
MAEQTIKNLVWIDLETTGLSTKKDKIIEIGILVTDTNLNILDPQGYVGYVNITNEDISLMDDLVKEMHTKNSVIEKCLESKSTLEDIDKESVKYIAQFVDRNEAPLCGTNIAFDRSFIEYNMPLLTNHLHFRNIDVSTIKQLSRIGRNDVYKGKESTHEALDDIRESIEELRYYKEKIF